MLRWANIQDKPQSAQCTHISLTISCTRTHVWFPRYKFRCIHYSPKFWLRHRFLINRNWWGRWWFHSIAIVNSWRRVQSFVWCSWTQRDNNLTLQYIIRTGCLETPSSKRFIPVHLSQMKKIDCHGNYGHLLKPMILDPFCIEPNHWPFQWLYYLQSPWIKNHDGESALALISISVQYLLDERHVGCNTLNTLKTWY